MVILIISVVVQRHTLGMFGKKGIKATRLLNGLISPKYYGKPVKMKAVNVLTLSPKGSLPPLARA
jgi:hypothetical protein